MAAAALTPGDIRSLVRGNGDLSIVEVSKVTQNDWIVFGTPIGFFDFMAKSGADETATRAVAAVNDVANITATATTITYDGATSGQFPASGSDTFYILVDSEIMKVTSYTSTVLTVVRGQMGTTAAPHANDAVVYVLNTVVLAGAVVGPVRGVVEYMYE